MTSGEWDLRALRALEEEELAQFRAISEPELFKIPPPAQLPTIDEFCGSNGSGLGGSNSDFSNNYNSNKFNLNDDLLIDFKKPPIIPLPPSIFTKSSLSGKLLGSPTKGLKKFNKIGNNDINNYCPTLTRSATLNRTRKLNKNHYQRQIQHQFYCNKNSVNVGGGGGSIAGITSNLSELNKSVKNIKQKNINNNSNNNNNNNKNNSNTNCSSPLSSISSSNNSQPSSSSLLIGNSSVVPPSTIVDQANEMMTMMMFLSSTAPPELSSGASATTTDNNTSSSSNSVGNSSLSTFMMCTSKTTACDDGNDDGLITYSSINRNISAGNKKLSNSNGCNKIGHTNNASTLGRSVCKAHGINGNAKAKLLNNSNVDEGNNSTSGMDDTFDGNHVPGVCPIAIAASSGIDYEIEDHIKHCSCSCNHMGYGNSMDYQTTGFGGLPDVTEHSNIKRTTSRQDSLSNSESAIEISSLQKSSKKSLKSNRSSLTSSASETKKKKFCILSFMSLFGLIVCAGIATIFVYQLVFMSPSRNSHDERIKIVKKILNEIPLVDGHNDLAWNVRKYAHSSLELLDLNYEVDHKTVWHRPAWSQTDITRLKEGLVGAQIWSAYVPCDAQGLDAVQLALEQIDIIHRFTELHSTETTLVISSQEIIQAHSKGLIASLIGIEGGHALGSSLGVLRSFHSLGARYLTLTHQCDTTWAGSSSMTMDKGLTGFGKSVIKEMNRLGMLIDLTHSSDVTAKDVLDVTRAPVIFSHSVARALCNSTRNVPDDILRAVADNGGLIMISFDSDYISCSDSSTLNDVISHIKYIRSIAGIEHIGIGAGYDGIEHPPIGLEDVSKYPNLFATLLEDSSWSEEDLAKLAGKNFIRVLKSVENVRDYWKRAAIQPVETSEPIKKSQCTYMSS